MDHLHLQRFPLDPCTPGHPSPQAFDERVRERRGGEEPVMLKESLPVRWLAKGDYVTSQSATELRQCLLPPLR